MKKIMVVAVMLILVGGAGAGGYYFYNTRCLSSDLRRTLTAAMDPSASENDILAYLRDARLQVRTKKDTEVLKKFQGAIDNAQSAQEIRNRQWQKTLDSMRNMNNTPADKLSAIAGQYRQENLPVPEALSKEIHDAYEEQIKQIQSDREEDKGESQLADLEEATARKLIGELRATLGLPPLKETK
jgi:hypothetical protein